MEAFWTIERIVEATGGIPLGARRGQVFSKVAIDSRRVKADQLFVAIRGERHDGHDFLGHVVDLGVRGVVIDEARAAALPIEQWGSQGVVSFAVADTVTALGALAAHMRRQSGVTLAAITGSTGKTTTRHMAQAVISRRFKTLATRGNLNNEIGLPLTLLDLEPGHEAAVVELGMNHPGEIGRLAQICRPDIGVITNIGPAHLEGVHTLEGVARAKGELLTGMQGRGKAVLNVDDEHLLRLAQTVTMEITWFGFSADATVRAEDVSPAADGIVFQLRLPGARIPVRLPFPGVFMVANALAAAAVGHLCGLTADEIRSGLEGTAPVEGRLVCSTTADGVHLIDDTYNANPKSMAAAIETLVAVRGGARSVLVAGDMLELGAQAGEWHGAIGRLCGRSGLSRLYLLGQFAPVLGQAARGEGMAAGDIFSGTREEIIADLLEWLRPGDWVLVKGSRAMRMEAIVHAIQTRFPASAGPAAREPH